ncbi:Pr6Pr family membrane protein [Microbacterium sp. A1-JK]|uniref:Pr6Pr family membrane protein n=1 Tax=Microbacterium sp. A1-JK TaxID=3177516 RepID=UPI00388B4D1D
MTHRPPLHIGARTIGAVRVGVAVTVVLVLVYAYALRIGAGDSNPFDFFGYFTNQTSLLAAIVLGTVGGRLVAGRPVPSWLTTARAVVTAYLIVVAVVYNVVVPGTGSAPPWVSFLLHGVFPVVVLLDWILIGDRSRLPWRVLWTLLPYPAVWLAVVLIRGVTDGWVPYGFLLPGRGLPSLTAHIVGLIAAIVASGAVVWALSRTKPRVVLAHPRRSR